MPERNYQAAGCTPSPNQSRYQNHYLPKLLNRAIFTLQSPSSEKGIRENTINDKLFPPIEEIQENGKELQENVHTGAATGLEPHEIRIYQIYEQAHQLKMAAHTKLFSRSPFP